MRARVHYLRHAGHSGGHEPGAAGGVRRRSSTTMWKGEDLARSQPSRTPPIDADLEIWTSDRLQTASTTRRIGGVATTRFTRPGAASMYRNACIQQPGGCARFTVASEEISQRQREARRQSRPHETMVSPPSPPAHPAVKQLMTCHSKVSAQHSEFNFPAAKHAEHCAPSAQTRNRCGII